MRKYIIIALVLLVGGIAASIYLIPTAREVAGMQATDMQAVNLGNVDIEAEYAQGRRSYPIIAALADKRAAAGDRAAGTKLLEEFVASNPNDINGRKKLAEFYLAGGNMEGYNQQLEAIATAAPTEENLRVLSDLYNSNKEYVKQAEVLKKILEVTHGDKPQAFVDLATIQVVIGDNEGALKTVEDLKAKHPSFSSYPMTRIMVSVLSDKGDVDRAYAAAKEWMDKPGAPVPAPNTATPAGQTPPVTAAQTAPLVNAAAGEGNSRPKELADLCNILHYSGHADKAVQLVDLYPSMLENEPELVLAYVNANITAGKSDHAYEVLKKIDDSGKMVASLYPPYLDLTIKREDIPAADAIATKIDIATFSEEMALNIIEVARANQAPSVLKILTTRFNEPVYLQEKPVLDAVIAIVTNEKTQDQKIEVALNKELTSTQRLRLAESCARAKKTACFEAIVKLYPPLEQMNPPQVAEYAQLFIIAERQAELVDPVGKLVAVEHPAAQTQIAHRRLSAAAGRYDVLKSWLASDGGKVPMNQLVDLFYLANDRGHTDISTDIAERLYARDPSPMNRNLMIAAYVRGGDYAKAMPLLREQMQEPGANDSMYLTALSNLGRKDPAARKELADYAQAALTAGRGDDRQQINYAYIMINNGRKAEVIPFAKANAEAKGGEWKKMYAQLTTKPKTGTAAAGARPVKLSREQLIAMSNSKSINALSKRQIAFNLLNQGYKQDAVVIFKDLAKDKGPDSQEVKDLLYLWGGKLNAEQLAWVQQRASTANAYDKERWAALVNNVADDNSVLSYVSSTPEALYNADLRKKYFRILAGTGSKQNYDVAMRGWVAETTDVPALVDYSTVAQNYGFRDAAVNGYNRVLTLDPNNSKALSSLAALDFSKGKYRSADSKLDQYIANQQQRPDPETNPAQAHFYKAELLRRQGNKAGAMAEYQQVIGLTTQAGAAAPDALSRMYTAQFHLGQHVDAKAGFEQLLEQYPDDKGVLADYMSVLIEYKYLDDATRVANQYDKNSPYYRPGASLAGHSAHTASIERLSNGRELKISFDHPIEEGKSPIDMKAAKKMAWLEKVDTAYDSVSIAAKPGYTVRYVPTSEEQFAVVAAEEPNYAPQVEAQRQQDLRLQLLYARIEQESGQQDKAQQRLAALRQYYPNDPQLLSYQASVESANGNVEEATALIERARSVAPENEDFTLQAQNIRRVESGVNYVKLDHEYRALGKNDEQITTLSGVVQATRSLELGMNVQNDFLDTNQTRRASDGRIADYSTTRQRGEIYAATSLGGGDRLQGSLFANNKDVGAGAYYSFNNPIGRTELIGEYRRPYWDFVEAVYEHTTRDRVGLKHYATLRPTTTLGFEGSVNNYNTDEADSVAQSVLVRLNVVQELQPMTANQPYLGVGYGFDGEYFSGEPDTKTTAFGTNDILPVSTREIHALTGIYRDDWTEDTHALFVGGFAYDRIHGGFSPLGEIRVDHDLDENWQVGGRARYALETNNTDNKALNLGADLIYKF
ncbi:MAG: tetratricopeptide repeat protein [Rickettsiales bacterium]